MFSSPFVIEQPERQQVLGVRLRPAGAYAVLARPVLEISGLAVDLGDVIGREATELTERCYDAVTVAERFRLVADWISTRIARSHRVDEAIAWSATRIDRSGGSVPIAELRAETGLSKARLTGVFREQIGLAPKVYARVVRFRHVLSRLQQGDGRLAEVALDAGFYDQPHMNAEFRALAGVTPREFLAARHPVGDGSTAADLPA
jgi:AraC-like DNA-binding protein